MEMEARMTLNNFKHRVLYQGGKGPNWLAKILNAFWAMVHSSGIAPNWMVTLEVVGRKSGKIVALPVAVAWVDGQRYLVSMLGDEAQWVKNVRAAHGRAFIRAGRRTAVQLEEVPVDQRAPILKAYLQVAPGARPHIPVRKEAPVADFEAVAANYPAFRIVPAQAE